MGEGSPDVSVASWSPVSLPTALRGSWGRPSSFILQRKRQSPASRGARWWALSL